MEEQFKSIIENYVNFTSLSQGYMMDDLGRIVPKFELNNNLTVTQ